MLATRSSVAVRPVRVSAVRVAPRVVRVRAQPVSLQDAAGSNWDGECGSAKC